MADKTYTLRDLPAMPRDRRLPFLWQYYRFHLLALFAVLLVSGAFIHNLLTKPTPDFEVLALCAPLSAQDTAALETSLSAFFPDYDGDGTPEVTVLHRPLAGSGAAETGTMAIVLSALQDGEAPLLLLNDAAAALLFSIGGLADETGAPAAALDAAVRLPAADFPALQIPAQEPLAFYRPVLPEDEAAQIALQNAIFTQLDANT